MTRVLPIAAMFLLAIGAASMTVSTARADDADVWDKITGDWVVDFDATAELPELKDAEKAQVKGTKAAGVKIMIAVSKGAAELQIHSPNDKSKLAAEWRIVSEDAKGAFIESLTGGGARKERVSVTYLPGGTLKYAFADMPFPLVMKKAAKDDD